MILSLSSTMIVNANGDCVYDLPLMDIPFIAGQHNEAGTVDIYLEGAYYVIEIHTEDEYPIHEVGSFVVIFNQIYSWFVLPISRGDIISIMGATVSIVNQIKDEEPIVPALLFA